LFATISFVDSQDPVSIEFNKNLNEGYYYYDFNEYVNVKSVYVYVTNDDLETGILCNSQTLLVGADGIDGKDGKDGKDGQAGEAGTSIVSTTVEYGISMNDTDVPEE
jgi:hypothetical protein